MLPSYEPKTRTLNQFYDLWKKGHINLRPEYQRGKVWPDSMKAELVASVLNRYPIGLIMVNLYQDMDKDGVPIEKYDIVDGQQRMTSLFEYRDDTDEWVFKAAKRGAKTGFWRYKELSEARKERFDLYELAIAFMKDYEEDEIQDIYCRLQKSKPLRIGEKIKAIPSSFKPYIKNLTEHDIFKIAGGRLRVRDGHWNLATIFFRSIYLNQPLLRHEYDKLEGFLKRTPQFNQKKATSATEQARTLLNYQSRVTKEAINQDPPFQEVIGTARYMKWVFYALYFLNPKYALAGKEHLVANGIRDYYKKKDETNSEEWACYLNTGRTGRIDTPEVKVCLEQLMTYIINASNAEPKDPKRFFSAAQREELFKRADGKCAICNIDLSKTNFHADHIVAHTAGGITDLANGQVLCTKCNKAKGGSNALFLG